MQSFISTGTLYDAEHTDHMEFRNDDESKRAEAFRPSSFSQVNCSSTKPHTGQIQKNLLPPYRPRDKRSYCWVCLCRLKIP